MKDDLGIVSALIAERTARKNPTQQMGCLQLILDLALVPRWGNSAEYIGTFVVPAGTKIYVGYAASQSILDSHGNVTEQLLGGGTQVFIPKS